MGNITIRNLPDNVHSALKRQAALNERSTEAEVRFIIAASVASNTGLGLGASIRAAWGDNLGNDLDIERSSKEIKAATLK